MENFWKYIKAVAIVMGVSARREACGCNEYIDGAMLEADRRGWDCFKNGYK